MLLGISACGGGGGNSNTNPTQPNTPSNQSPIGLWQGQTSQGVEFVGLVTQDEFYILAASEYQARLPANVVYGKWEVSGNTFKSIDALDISVEYEQINPVNITGTVSSNQQFNGSINYGALGTITFSSNFSNNYNRQASIEEITGLTRGIALRESGYDTTIARISSNGTISGQTYSGCSLSGSISPSNIGNYYTSQITSTCSNSSLSIDALAYFDEESKELVILGFDEDPSAGVIYWGTVDPVVSSESVSQSPLASSNTLSKAEGFWSGTSSDNRLVTGLVTADGEGYFIYSEQNSSVFAGVSISSFVNTSEGVLSSESTDFSFEGLSLYDLSISADVTPGASLNAILDYGSLGQRTASLSYLNYYENTASLSNITGSYNGFSAVSSGIENTQISIDSNGRLNGLSQLGCAVKGYVSPRDRGNIFNLSISFNSSQCLYQYQVFKGVLVKTESGQLIAIAPNNTSTDAVLFISN